MFTKDKKSNGDRPVSNSATLISAGTIVNGDLVSDNDLRIDGTINGNVSSTAKIVVGPSGYVEGNIEGLNADITGKVRGNITVKELIQLRDNSNVQGNIAAEKLQIEPTATFNGQCKMGSSGTVQILRNELEIEASEK